jgi:septum site-determining protein MinC
MHRKQEAVRKMTKKICSPSQPVLEFKGNMLTMMVLYLYEVDNALIAQELKQKITQAPAIFKNAPVVLDLKALKDTSQPLDIPFLIQQMQQHGLFLMGIRGGSAQQQQQAQEAGIGLLAETKTPGRTHTKKTVDLSPFPPGSKIISQPIRSGQQVVANQWDLVILSMVSAGAEVLATGNIHVYGALRGRALAGVTGNTQARIFCQQFNAELVAVAGHYQVNEDVPAEVRHKPVQVYLQDDQLYIQVFA